jgi:hypothetical protein
MGKFSGRKARVYMGTLTSDQASPVAYMASYSLNAQVEKLDVTSFGENNKTYVTGLPDSQGEFSGFADDASAQTYTAAVDGLARKFYLYPSTDAPTSYFFGTILPDYSISGGVSEATTLSVTWVAYSDILRVN